MSKLMTAAEVATRLNVSKRTLARLVQCGRLPVVRLRGCVRFTPEAVEALLRPSGLGRPGGSPSPIGLAWPPHVHGGPASPAK